MAQLAGITGNQTGVARVLDHAFNSGSGLSLVSSLYGLSAGQIGQALTTLSGSNASVGVSSSVMAGGQFAALLANRAASRQQNAPQSAELAAGCRALPTEGEAQACDPAPNWSAWGNGFGGAQWLNADAGTAAPAAQQGILGGAFGGDYRVGPNTLLGIAVGLSDSSYSVGATGASGRATGFHVGLYGTQDWAGFYLNAAAAYSRFDGNATRVIAGVGTTETAKSNAIANQLAGRVEIGRPFLLNPDEPSRYSVTPFAALQPVQLWTPGYSETSVTASGAPGVFALSYQPQSTTSLPLFLGVQFDAATEIRSRPVSAWVRAAWVHEFLPNRNVTAGFTVLPGATFTVDGARAAYNAARIDMGVKYAVGEQTFLFANGGAELSDRGQMIGGTVGLRFVW
jgi:subtilase-type serine protease